jgi:hypothetical protein
LQAPKDRPQLKRLPDGSVTVLGGIAYDPHATPPPATVAKLSDRPPALPLSSATPETSKKKSKSPAKPQTTSTPKGPKQTPTPKVSPTPTVID